MKIAKLLADTFALIALPTLAYTLTGSHFGTFTVFITVLIYQETRYRD